jgi:hypothetical protein
LRIQTIALRANLNDNIEWMKYKKVILRDHGQHARYLADRSPIWAIVADCQVRGISAQLLIQQV